MTHHQYLLLTGTDPAFLKHARGPCASDSCTLRSPSWHQRGYKMPFSFSQIKSDTAKSHGSRFPFFLRHGLSMQPWLACNFQRSVHLECWDSKVCATFAQAQTAQHFHFFSLLSILKSCRPAPIWSLPDSEVYLVNGSGGMLAQQAHSSRFHAQLLLIKQFSPPKHTLTILTWFQQRRMSCH